MSRKLHGQHITMPPPPPGALGWNVYTDAGTFIEFIPEEEELGKVAAKMADDAAAYAQCCGNQPAGPGFECTCAEGCSCGCAHCACSPQGDNGDPR